MDLQGTYTADRFTECLDLELKGLRDSLLSSQGMVSQDTFSNFSRCGSPFFNFAKLSNGYVLTFALDALDVKLVLGYTDSVLIDYTPIGFDCCVYASFGGSHPIFYRGGYFDSFQAVVNFLLSRDVVASKYTGNSFLSHLQDDLHELSTYCLSNNIPLVTHSIEEIKASLSDIIYMRSRAMPLFTVGDKCFGFLAKTNVDNADYINSTCLMDLGDIYLACSDKSRGILSGYGSYISLLGAMKAICNN